MQKIRQVWMVMNWVSWLVVRSILEWGRVLTKVLEVNLEFLQWLVQHHSGRQHRDRVGAHCQVLLMALEAAIEVLLSMVHQEQKPCFSAFARNQTTLFVRTRRWKVHLAAATLRRQETW